MRDDLLEPHGCVLWVLDQLPSLTERLDAWLAAHVTTQVRDVAAPATHNPIVAFEDEFLPVSFSIEVGAYLNTLRSGLDILAMTLVNRHQLEIPEHKVYFPITATEPDLRSSALFKALPEPDRARLFALQSYRDANRALWALHRLDIVRKHRRLLEIQLRPIHLSISGTLQPGDFEPLHGEPFQAGSETVIGLIRKGLPDLVVQTRFYVGLVESDLLPTRPVGATLAYLADAAMAAIQAYDL